jgi:hypothetical protein
MIAPQSASSTPPRAPTHLGVLQQRHQHLRLEHLRQPRAWRGRHGRQPLLLLPARHGREQRGRQAGAWVLRAAARGCTTAGAPPRHAAAQACRRAGAAQHSAAEQRVRVRRTRRLPCHDCAQRARSHLSSAASCAAPMGCCPGPWGTSPTESPPTTSSPAPGALLQQHGMAAQDKRMLSEVERACVSACACINHARLPVAMQRHTAAGRGAPRPNVRAAGPAHSR